MTVKLPREILQVTDMPLYVPIKSMNIRRSSSSIRSFSQLMESTKNAYFQQPKCTISSERVKTFDDKKFTVPLTTCYSVLAKDCSGEQPKFAVLMKKLQQQKEAKKLKVITENQVVELEAKQQVYLANEEDPVKVLINGERVQLVEGQVKVIRHHGHVVCQVEQLGKYIKVVLPEEGLKIYFDGYTCSIKMSSIYSNAQCGLCGHFDGNLQDEYRNPQNQLVENIQNFYKGYFMENDECQIDQQIVNDEEYYRYKPFLWENEDSKNLIERSDQFSESFDDSLEKPENQLFDQEILSNSYEQEQWQPRPKTVIVEMSHEICFSKVAVPQCPKNTYPIESKQYQKIGFACLPRTSSEAQSLRLWVQQREQVIETETLRQSMVETVLVPKMCKQF